ncbi:MAG: D-alanyl-D-alanine endopeptidase [Burkholderiales bacterium]|nr:D-alanyl-D-alanine endopeptidase [Burkholderiales bacterium]
MNRVLPLVFAGFLAAPVLAAPALDSSKLKLASANAIVIDAADGTAVYSKAADEVTPIASVTKLMTAVVVLDAKQPMDEQLEVDMGDFDYLKGSRSRLHMGATLSREQMLHLALMASENRAASSLGRHYPGGQLAFVAAMNEKARSLGMTSTHYDDATGLSPKNVSTANDLAKLVRAAAAYPEIREFSTTPAHRVEVSSTGQTLGFNNSNALVKNDAWDIQLQKTGYIREAGRCVVMLANIASRPVVIVLLDSIGKLARVTDAQRVKYWLETGEAAPAAMFRPAVHKTRGKAPGKAAGKTATGKSSSAKVAGSKRTQGKLAANRNPRG